MAGMYTDRKQNGKYGKRNADIAVGFDGNSELKEAIKKNKVEGLEFLKKLIRIESVASNSTITKNGEIYPFGQGVQSAFNFMLSEAEKLGFETMNADNYGGHIDLGQGDETLGILAHLDVVPSGDGWEHPPYSAYQDDEFLWGRGTTDDKGPLVACFFAMKALKEAGYRPSKKVRLILGLDEETEWKGVEYYFSKVAPPDFGFTPDGDFPVINGEMGAMTFRIVGKLDGRNQNGMNITRLSGGTADNMVADRARAVIMCKRDEIYQSIKDEAKNFSYDTGYKLNMKMMGKALEVSACGKAAHGAMPEKGLNAISILISFLSRFKFDSDGINDFMNFYNEYIGFELDGRRLGIYSSDEKTGNTIVNVGVLGYNKDSISIDVNVRYPVCTDADHIYDLMMPILDENGFGVIKMSDKPAFYLEPDSPLIRTLAEIYRMETGDGDNAPLISRGTTYAKTCDNMVAFGGLFPGDPDIMHQANERLALKRFDNMIDIYAKVIYHLASENFQLTD